MHKVHNYLYDLAYTEGIHRLDYLSNKDKIELGRLYYEQQSLKDQEETIVEGGHPVLMQFVKVLLADNMYSLHLRNDLFHAAYEYNKEAIQREFEKVINLLYYSERQSQSQDDEDSIDNQLVGRY